MLPNCSGAGSPMHLQCNTSFSFGPGRLPSGTARIRPGATAPGVTALRWPSEVGHFMAGLGPAAGNRTRTRNRSVDRLINKVASPATTGWKTACPYERITVDPDVISGLHPRIRGLRIPAASVVAMVADGMSSDGIVAETPHLTGEDVVEALRYAAHRLLSGTPTA